MLSCGVLLDHGVFNVALQTLLDKDRKKIPHLRVPLIFQEVCVLLLLCRGSFCNCMFWL